MDMKSFAAGIALGIGLICAAVAVFDAVNTEEIEFPDMHMIDD